MLSAVRFDIPGKNPNGINIPYQLIMKSQSEKYQREKIEWEKSVEKLTKKKEN